MAIDFLEKKETDSPRVRKLRKWAEGGATVVLVGMLIFGTGILGSWLYVRKEVETMTKRKIQLVGEVGKLALEEVQVLQIAARSELVTATAKDQGKAAAIMEKIIPEEGVEVVNWRYANGINQVDIQSDYPYLLEKYTSELAKTYSGLEVGKVNWSQGAKWQLNLTFGGGEG